MSQKKQPNLATPTSTPDKLPDKLPDKFSTNNLYIKRLVKAKYSKTKTR